MICAFYYEICSVYSFFLFNHICDNPSHKEEFMLNQVVLVGKVVRLPELKETSSGVKFADLLIEVERNFKNGQGEYENDTILCTLWRTVAETTIEQCELGSLLGIKGRLQSNSYETKDNGRFYYCEVIAEKVSFLTSK